MSQTVEYLARILCVAGRPILDGVNALFKKKRVQFFSVCTLFCIIKKKICFIYDIIFDLIFSK